MALRSQLALVKRLWMSVWGRGGRGCSCHPEHAGCQHSLRRGSQDPAPDADTRRASAGGQRVKLTNEDFSTQLRPGTSTRPTPILAAAPGQHLLHTQLLWTYPHPTPWTKRPGRKVQLLGCAGHRGSPCQRQPTCLAWPVSSRAP